MTAHSSTIAAAASEEPAVGAVLVGGDRLFREGLVRLFGDSRVRVLAAGQAPEEIDAAAPGVVVLLGDVDAIGTVPAVRRRWPAARLVLLAAVAESGTLTRAIAAGLDGYLLKDMSPEALAHAIVLVTLGANVFPTRLTPELMRTPEPERSARLTRREVDILNGLLDGCSNKVIARQLGTTDATVKAQLRHLLRKIGAENRTQAALWAREHGVGRAAEGLRLVG